MEIRVSGLDAVIRKVETYKDSLRLNIKKFLEELAKIGISEAEVRFSKARYDGDNTVDVGAIWEGDNTLRIRASGNAVLFIEFGTGVFYSEQHPDAQKFQYERGAYGKGYGSRKAWGYYGTPGPNGDGRVRHTDKGPLTITHGNPPARAMYDSAKIMREQITKIAKEVFLSK